MPSKTSYLRHQMHLTAIYRQCLRTSKIHPRRVRLSVHFRRLLNVMTIHKKSLFRYPFICHEFYTKKCEYQSITHVYTPNKNNTPAGSVRFTHYRKSVRRIQIEDFLHLNKFEWKYENTALATDRKRKYLQVLKYFCCYCKISSLCLPLVSDNFIHFNGCTVCLKK